MFDDDDLRLARTALELALEDGDEDEIAAARDWLRQLKRKQWRDPWAVERGLDYYDQILQGT